MSENLYGVKAIGVRTVACDKLKPNPHNPRHLFDKEDMEVLQESIARVGILVPLTVYLESKTNAFVILDGQRRWICAQEVGLKSVPVNEVAEPSLVQNIVTMFQIHKLRKDWELMPTALKLDLLMTKLQDRNDRRIAKLTGLDEAMVTRCKKLLSYAKPYQEMMLEPDPEDRVKSDFFIELYVVRNDREVNKFPWFAKDAFTDAMLEKHKSGVLKSVTEFRIIKQHINNAVKAGKTETISKRLREFASQPKLTHDHLNIESAEISANARKMLAGVDKLYSEVKSIDLDDFFGEEQLWKRLDELAKLIQNKLKQLGWRSSK